jgi:hypothetical protein
MTRSQIVLFLWAFAGIAPMAGCGDSKPATGSGSETESHGGHAYEHHNPPHKPRDFPGGLAALRLRFTQFFKSPASPTPETNKDFTKLVDIVGWLPELAADSDLDRVEWDRVNEQSKQMARDVDSFAHSGLDDARQRIRQQIEVALQALEDVVGRHPDMFGKSAPVQGTAREANPQDISYPRT